MKILPFLLLLCLLSLPVHAQDKPNPDPDPAPAPAPAPAEPKPTPAPTPAPTPTPDKATSTGSSARIVVEASGEALVPPPFYSAEVVNQASIGAKQIDYQVALTARILQGDDPTLSFHTRGEDNILAVTGPTLASWSVRWDVEKKRYLDLKLKPDPKRKPGSVHQFTVQMRSDTYQLPTNQQITNFSRGEGATSLNQIITLSYADGIRGRVTEITGFLPVEAADGQKPNRFQSSVGGKFRVQIDRSSASPDPVELSGVRLSGKKSAASDSIDFQLNGTARVSKDGASIDLLHGDAAFSELPESPDYRLELVTIGKQPAYRLTFAKAGEFPLDLRFVAGLQTTGGQKGLDFKVAGGAVVPVSVEGLDAKIDFQEAADTISPTQTEGGEWIGFVPANGHARMFWRSSRKVGEGRLFFSTIARIEATVGAGLLRQQHDIEFRILQGDLKQLDLDLSGPGEVLGVEGKNVTAWTVVDADAGTRRLEVKLSQAVTDTAQLRVRTRTALDALPVRTKTVRLTPVGAVRHSGYLRVSNQGSVRLEPTDLSGLTQLAPDQFPGGKIEARQVFAYRFPAADHSLEIAADRIEPEVSVSEVTVYRLAKTDRMISSDIELDIREAPIREWDIGVPEDYSIVSVVGAAVADYVPGSEVADGRRTLKVLFNGEVSGRQLIQIHLEKNETVAAGDWTLPSLTFPEAKSVRGDLGVIGEAGYRVAAGDVAELVEKPLSLFPKAIPGLQQAFRIRESNWTATMQIEVLKQSVQADVFHLHSLNDRSASTSVVFSYLITGAPVSEWRIALPEGIENVEAEGRDIRSRRRDEDSGDLIVSLQQPVMGLYQLLVTYEEDLGVQAEVGDSVTLRPGRATPLGVQGERGYIQVVSPVQVDVKATTASKGLLELDAIELPAELRLLAQAPALGSWQYTERPFELQLGVRWFEPGSTLQQVVDFVEITTRISADGELVSEALYYVRSRGQRALRLQLPEGTRLWAASVSGRSVAARQGDDNDIRIPLPGTADANLPVEVRLRVGKPTGKGAKNHPRLALPVLSIPTLKADWRIIGDKDQILRPTGGTVAPSESPHPLNGAVWLAKFALGSIALIALFSLVGLGISRTKNSTGARLPLWRTAVGIIAIGAAIYTSLHLADRASHITAIENANALRLSLPAIAAGEIVELNVRTLPAWRNNISILGILIAVGGIAALGFSIRRAKTDHRSWLATGVLLLSVGILLQANSARAFLLLLAIVLAVVFLVPRLWTLLQTLRGQWQARKERKRKAHEERAKAMAALTEDKSTTPGDANDGGSGGSKTLPTSLLILAAVLSGSIAAPSAFAADDSLSAADSSVQTWTVEADEKRIRASVEMEITGKAGDQFLLLSQPAVMTEINVDEAAVRVIKKTLANRGLSYVAALSTEGTHTVKFHFDYRVADLAAGIPLPTGNSAVQRVAIDIDHSGWEVLCPTAVRISPTVPDPEGKSAASLLLAPGRVAQISLRPKPRDVSQEETRFYVEANQLYLPGPGVIDGYHQLQIRPSQGQVSALSVTIPDGLTVSSVEGPIASWQFDAEKGKLQLAIEPPQAATFTVKIGSQRGLDPLPADANLQPLRVESAAGEVGMVALAFGADAQPEKAESDQLPTINAGDFSAAMVQEHRAGAVLHRVFRYGTGTKDGNIAVRVAPVAPEVRVSSKQVLSLGDERVVLSVQFAADITRSGLFQLSFPLPDGFEVESLTGAALHHWSEITDEDGTRQVVLHLNGKTLGNQGFSLTLTGAAPQTEGAESSGEWNVPRFQLNEAERHIGDLIVNATTGVSLRSINRINATEVDPRSLGGNSRGALAFRLLQSDWTLVLGVEQLAPWITANVLHDVTLREGQTRTTLLADFEVRNASIRSLLIRLPITDEDEIKTVRASGGSISDLVRTSPDSDLWELRFKRRVVGKVQARIEFERRESRAAGSETLTPVTFPFPDGGQVAYHFAVRSSGRLELGLTEDSLPRGWQAADWASIPNSLRDAGIRTAPNLTLRAVAFDQSLTLQLQRHSLAQTLKLRVANGTLTTILSPLGDRVTAVELTAEVIQRGSLTVTLPENGQLFSIFVNDESVHSIREGRDWRFHVLPGVDQRYASVRFIYSAPGDGLRNLDLQSPPMNVPLENITWRVVAPPGFELSDDDGDLQLHEHANWQLFDRQRYLEKAQRQHDSQAQHAAQLLEQAGQFRQQGEQDRALWALNSVVNQYALDAATNEDARVQLQNLQTQNAIVGLNTRRQRLYLDNATSNDELVGAAGGAPSEQLKQGAAANPVLQEGAVNLMPQAINQLMQGNTGEENAVLHRIGTRMVEQQRSAEAATQALTVTLPEEGRVYAFTRAVQVAENAPLELNLSFKKIEGLSIWRFAALVALLAILGFALVGRNRKANNATPAE